MLLSSEQLAKQIESTTQVIVDCRFSLADADAGYKAYLQGHIPGAVYANLDTDLSSEITPESGRHPLPQVSQFLETLTSWGIGNETHVIVYDDMGGAVALRLWWLLKWLGHEKVSLLDGGWNKWISEGRPADTGESVSVNTPVEYSATAEDSLWLSTEHVEQDILAGKICLLDARAHARFIGEQEPIDPVAGHVPGAINRPMQLNLDENGCFLSGSELRKQFSPLLGGCDPRNVVHMCGSGVTACHNLFAMELAGLQGSKLYPGSWSEWIRYAAREVAGGQET